MEKSKKPKKIQPYSLDQQILMGIWEELKELNERFEKSEVPDEIRGVKKPTSKKSKKK